MVRLRFENKNFLKSVHDHIGYFRIDRCPFLKPFKRVFVLGQVKDDVIIPNLV